VAGDGRWLDWVRRLRATAQSGLTYAQTPFERERWELVQRVAAEMAAGGNDTPAEAIAGAFAADAGHATPKVDVRAIVFRDGKLLLVRGLDDGLWTPPGGWAEVGERPSEAVEKEVREESGYRVRAVKLLAVHDRDLRHRPRWPSHAYKLFFECELLADEPDEPSPHETDAVGFFGEDELPGLSERAGARDLAWVFEHFRDPERTTDFD
jgi:ADP-ribose pyrophosphatase YjhB (NUDIX family)